MDANASADFKAHVGVKPIRSQVVLVALIGVAAISLICTTILLATGNMAGLALLLFAFAALGASLYGWLKSQSDADLDQAHPTAVTTSDGTLISTDTRTLRSSESVAGLVRLVELLHRQPLPPASGMLDAKSQIIEGSEAIAIEAVMRINGETQNQTNEVLDALRMSQIKEGVAQSSVNEKDTHGPEISPSEAKNG
ncbi:hypothetical protein [Variovorax sp. IB41]|uniref:hypothetical protein n=1 Tax=Variovorax sp. IB41 TaxID=2779370 RepID=UPI0018E8B896|nr:hypothetical protein [Variovorax sp. IB41]MBJ2156657.1 hypothetical protein [Variovorax sp. IB41]